jgi:pantoate--beta-alanine ligase
MSAEVIGSIAALREALARIRRAGGRVGLVPTMGALHAGHARLIEQAVRETDCAVVSIFVNPIQFNDPRDYGQYPRTLVEDAALCGRLGAPIVFAPAGEEMYPRPQQSFVEVQGVTEFLCGQFRPGHFRGVATVVLKLFQIVQPDVAYFGEKDAQQLAVIRRMVSDLNVPLRIVEVATVREHDGLALSSRNRLLSGEERRLAPALYQVLRQAQERIEAGACDAAAVRREAVAALDERRIRVEYLEIVDPESMQPLERIDAPVRVAAAIWLGVTRLIDNLLCTPPAFEP